MNANVAILMTPPGSAAIAVVRLAGPGVTAFLKEHFSRSVAMRRCVHGDLMDGTRVIDDAVVVLCDPTVADLNIHGGPWVVRSTLDLVRREGFEVYDSPARPLPDVAMDAAGELEREVLSHLPLARTEVGVRVMLAQPKAWDGLKERAAADLPSVRAEVRRILADRTLHHLLHPPAVAIVGAPNVGKSTLANQLFARERSITADIPGTTRDWVGEIANVNGLPVMLMDTPGLRSTEDDVERAAIEQSRHEIQRADQVVLVLDASRPLRGEQSRLMEEFPDALRVVNKWDRSLGWDIERISGLATVATTGEGVERLRQSLVQKFCGEEGISIDRPRHWTPRQRTILERAANEPSHLSEL